VPPAQWPALQAELLLLLDWAHQRQSLRRGPIEEGGDWDYELQAQPDGACAPPQPLHYEPVNRQLRGMPVAWMGSAAASAPGQRTTLTLTLSASAAFSDALREQFGLE